MGQNRTLFIGRHAKSSWDFPGRNDIDRPLAERGLNNAYEMAKRMKKIGDRPEIFISSPANRALHTAVIFARELRMPFSRLQIDENLYMGGIETILDIISGVDNNTGSFMIFGHNPDFTSLANYFLKDQVSNIPTCGMVKLVFNANGWEDIQKSNLVDSLFDFPKNKSL